MHDDSSINNVNPQGLDPEYWERLGREPSEGAAQELVAAFRATGRTIAAAESLTAGLLCATIAAVPGASQVLRGGMVVYATDLKHHLAGVQPQTLTTEGPISPVTAVELAYGAAQRCGADIGVGVTGVAGPDRQDGHPVGEVFIAVVSLEPIPTTIGSTLDGEGVERRVQSERVIALLPEIASVLAEMQQYEMGAAQIRQWIRQVAVAAAMREATAMVQE